MECAFVQNKDCGLLHFLEWTHAEKLTLQGQCEEQRDYCDEELFLPTQWRGNKHEIKVDFTKSEAVL